MPIVALEKGGKSAHYTFNFSFKSKKFDFLEGSIFLGMISSNKNIHKPKFKIINLFVNFGTPKHIEKNIANSNIR